MPTSCSALRCTNRQKKGSGITFHSFPHDPLRRQKWVSATGRLNWTPSVHASLCSVHFEDKCFDRTGQTVRLRDGSVPTIFISPFDGRFRRLKRNCMPVNNRVKQEQDIVEKDDVTKRQALTNREGGLTEIRALQELDVDDHTYPRRSEKLRRCFMCDKAMTDGTQLRCLTATTKVQLHHKLDKILAGELSVEEDGELCSHCTQLVNYMDRIEAELAMLNRSILNTLRSKHILGLGHSQLCSKLPSFKRNQFSIVLTMDNNETDDFGANNPFTSNIEEVYKPFNMANKKNIIKSVNEKVYQCQICKFKTKYKSLIVFHLRQHLKTTYRCDFCTTALPEDALHLITTVDDLENNCLSTKEIDDLSTELQSPHSGKMINPAQSQQNSSNSAENLLQKVDNGGKVSNCTINANEKETKNQVLESMNVEIMLEELHSTGKISAFSADENFCKLSNSSETSHGVVPETSTHKHTRIKLESMNVDEEEGSGDVEIMTEGVKCRNHMFIDFGLVKSEAQNRDASVDGDIEMKNPEISVIERKLESSNKMTHCVIGSESTFCSSFDITDNVCDKKHLDLLSIKETVR